MKKRRKTPVAEANQDAVTSALTNAISDLNRRGLIKTVNVNGTKTTNQAPDTNASTNTNTNTNNDSSSSGTTTGSMTGSASTAVPPPQNTQQNKAIEKPLSPADQKSKNQLYQALKTAPYNVKNQLAKTLGVGIKVEMFTNNGMETRTKFFESRLHRDMWLMNNKNLYSKVLEWID